MNHGPSYPSVSPSLSYPSLPSPSSPSSTSSSSGTSSRKRSSKSHVPTACVNCKKAHLACDVSRPCKRCILAEKTDSCYDIQHKKRGRPKLRDKQSSGPWKHSRIVSSSGGGGGGGGGGGDGANAVQSLPQNTHCVMAVVPALAPGFSHSCFIMTQPPGGYHEQNSDPSHLLQNQQQPQIMTIFLSLDMCCARVSDECLEMIGLYPQELLHRSLYEWIAPESSDVLARVHQCLQSVRPPPPSPSIATTTLSTTSDVFVTHSPPVLLSIANGSQTFKEKLRLKRPDGSSKVLDARFYLGGGLGADLFLPATLDKLYIVCLLTTPIQRPSTAAASEEESPRSRIRTLIKSIAPNIKNNKQTRLSQRYDPPQHYPQEDTATTTGELWPQQSSQDDDDDDPPEQPQHQLIWMQPHDTVYHHPQHSTPTTDTPSTASMHSSEPSPTY